MMKIGRLALILTLLFLATGQAIAQTKVGVTRDITWRAYQSGLEVTNVSVDVLKANLHLFNNDFKVRYLVQGQVRYDKGAWRPRIRQVHYTERLILQDGDNRQGHGEIEIVPLVEVKEDHTYTGEWLPFTLRFDKWIQTYTWGSNIYSVVCGTVTTDVSVIQKK